MKTVITPTGKTSMAKLAQRMTRNFCSGVCATMHNWEVVQVGNMDKGARLMIRKSVQSLGEPSGIVLSATLSVWMPVQQQQLFDLLQNEELRSRWDLLSHGGQMNQMVCIAKGQDCGGKISLLSANVSIRIVFFSTKKSTYIRVEVFNGKVDGCVCSVSKREKNSIFRT